jgi:hypothetical protein
MRSLRFWIIHCCQRSRIAFVLLVCHYRPCRSTLDWSIRNAECRIRSRVISFAMHGWRSGTGTRFLSVFRFYLCRSCCGIAAYSTISSHWGSPWRSSSFSGSSVLKQGTLRFWRSTYLTITVSLFIGQQANSRFVSTSASPFGGLGCEIQPWERLSWLRVILIFSLVFRKNDGAVCPQR